jgi:hypothetical protein
MLPKSQKEMFSKSLVNEIVLMILPEDLFDEYQWKSILPKQDLPPVLDYKGIEWRLIGVFLVTYQNQQERCIEGVFVESDISLKDILDQRAWRDLVTQSDDERDLEDIMSDYSVKSEYWAFIHPSELYNVFFAKSAINYQQIL